ncbi:MAG: AAA family ATPase [Magnetococcales bacterium]|nr:AAA family ATPase [Magnetococcales bacterium]
MFTKLLLENFTVFQELTLDFAPGINVFVGANGTGKTHLLKLLYCLRESGMPHRPPLQEKLGAVFRPANNDFRRLVRHRSGRTTTHVHAEWGEKSMDVSWHGGSPSLVVDTSSPLAAEPPVYIPVKEVLSFAPGFISLYDKYEMAFEEVYCDILKLAYLPVRKGRQVEENQDLLEVIARLIGGRVVMEGDRFFVNHRDARLEMHLVAEGFRKLALLWQLIHNGTLLAGVTLFWDEPEANLNPFLMREVVKILVMLANRGIQVFLATHNYALLKELDLSKEATPITFFALDEAGEQGVTAKPCGNYAEISPNKIAEEYLLYRGDDRVFPGPARQGSWFDPSVQGGGHPGRCELK